MNSDLTSKERGLIRKKINQKTKKNNKNKNTTIREREKGKVTFKGQDTH